MGIRRDISISELERKISVRQYNISVILKMIEDTDNFDKKELFYEKIYKYAKELRVLNKKLHSKVYDNYKEEISNMSKKEKVQ